MEKQQFEPIYVLSIAANNPSLQESTRKIVDKLNEASKQHVFYHLDVTQNNLYSRLGILKSGDLAVAIGEDSHFARSSAMGIGLYSHSIPTSILGKIGNTLSTITRRKPLLESLISHSKQINTLPNSNKSKHDSKKQEPSFNLCVLNS